MKRAGFTLIELLVIISIIGILSSIVVVSLNTARKVARDNRRKADLNSIILALQLFYEDYGRYPDGSDGVNKLGECIGSDCGSGDVLETLLLPYLSHTPQDPSNNCTEKDIINGIAYACDDKYFYAYDYTHSASLGTCPSDPDVLGTVDGGIVGDTPSGAVVVSINGFEAIKDIHRDLCNGEDMGIGHSSYNFVLCKNGSGSDCFQTIWPWP